MIRTLSAALALVAGASPALAAQRDYSITDFDRVEVNGPYQVSLTVGRSSTARASGTIEALDRIELEVQGTTLRIHPNHSAWGGYPGRPEGGPITITLTTQQLRSAIVNGAGQLSIDKARGLRLDLSVTGSGELQAGTIDADTLSLALLGSGRMKLAGKAKAVRGEFHGSGSLEADALTTSDAQIVGDTAGSVRLAATRTATVISTASGDVTILGSPACTVKLSGNGSVHCGR